MQNIEWNELIIYEYIRIEIINRESDESWHPQGDPFQAELFKFLF